MNNLIDKDDFTGLTALSGMGQTWNSTDLDNFITMHQELIFKHILGEHLYGLLDANYVADSGDKWDLLINGDTYIKTYAGNDYNITYKGLKEALTYMIYFHYKNDIATSTTGGGEVVSSYENSSISKVDRKAIQAYNLGVDLIGTLIDNDDRDYVLVGDFPFFTTNVSVNPLKGNMVNYILFKNEETENTYPNWIFNSYTKVNEFGI